MAVVPQGKYSLLSQDVGTVIVNAATATGVARSYIFSVQPSKAAASPTVTCTVTGTFTVGTVTLQSSQDGGTTFNTHSAADTAKDVNASKVIQFTDIVSGLCYILNVASITGTSISISAVAS